MAAASISAGRALSRNALREELQVNHETVFRWLEIFERLYAIFRVPPFGAPRLRAVKKEQKHYHTDWSLVPDDGARLENLVASHLLKWVHHQLDTLGCELEIRYFRNVDGREVDFVVVERRRPILFVEAKLSATGIAPSLRYLHERFPNCPAYQVHLRGPADAQISDRIHRWPASHLLGTLV